MECRLKSSSLLNPKAFRHELTQCNAIVSGSVSPGFFDQSPDWYPNNHDIYVITGQCASQLHPIYSQARTAYISARRQPKDAPYAIHHISEVRTYSVLNSQRDESEHVPLICFIAQRCEQ